MTQPQWGPPAQQQFAPQPQQQWGPPAQQQAPQQWGPPAPGQQTWAPEQQFQQAQNQQTAQAIPSQTTDNTADMFGGAPGISWDVTTGYTLGTPRGGRVLSKVKSQVTDYTTKLPAHFPSGDPIMQIEVTLQTSERTDANDDGKRRMFIKSGLRPAAAQAFRAVGASDLEIDGWFYAACTSKTGGKNGKANVFQAVYARPGQPDPMAGQPAYVAPVQQSAPQQQFQAPAQPNYPQPGQQQWAPPAQQAAPAPQQFQQGPPQGYADPNQGQQQFAPQQPAQPQQQAPAPQWGPPAGDPAAAAQQPAGPPAGFNPFQQG